LLSFQWGPCQRIPSPCAGDGGCDRCTPLDDKCCSMALRSYVVPLGHTTGSLKVAKVMGHAKHSGTSSWEWFLVLFSRSSSIREDNRVAREATCSAPFPEACSLYSRCVERGLQNTPLLPELQSIPEHLTKLSCPGELFCTCLFPLLFVHELHQCFDLIPPLGRGR